MKGEKSAPALYIVGPVEDGCGPNPFAQFPWRLCRVPTCLEFTVRTRRIPSRVVVCERDLPDGDWRDILGIISCLRNPPPLVVTSRLADEYLWAEVLNLGGYDVLAKPFDTREVHRVVTLAWERAAAQQMPKRVRSATGRVEGTGICSIA